MRLFFFLLLFVSCQSFAEEFGSPDSVNNLIEEDAFEKEALVKQRASQDWFDWKAQLAQDHGISIGVDYTSAYLNSNEDGVSGDDASASGIFRFYGSWDLVNRGDKNTGSFVWKVEHRHNYTDLVPQGFGFDQGIIGLIEAPFSDEGTRLTNFYWKQKFNGGRGTITAGLLDTTDYFDVFLLASPWTGFLNFAFSTGTQTSFIPNDATMGIAVGSMLTERMYVIGGLTNAYSDPTDPLEEAGDFFSDNEYFTSIEIGWTGAQEKIYHENAHISYWHVDESADAGTPGGWGVNFQYVTYIDGKWMPFVRGGYADDGGTLLEKSVSIGLAYNQVDSSNLLGFAVNWGEPNEDSFGPDLNDQVAVEIFYRYQLTNQFVVTPDIQYVKDPAQNPSEDSLWIFGLRARLAL